MTSFCSYSKAHALIADQKYVEALKISGPILEAQPHNLLAWYQLTLSMQHLTSTETEHKNLCAVAKAFMESGFPLLALLCIRESQLPPEQRNELLKELAILYCNESDRLSATTNPNPFPKVDRIAPWSDTLEATDTKQMAQSLGAISWSNSLTLNQSLNQNESSIPPIPWLSSLPQRAFIQFASELDIQSFSAGDKIIQKGTLPQNGYIPVIGTTAIEETAQGVTTYRRIRGGETMGESLLITRTPAPHDIVATEFTVAFVAPLPLLESQAIATEALLNELIQRSHYQLFEQIFYHCPILQPLSFFERTEVLKRFKPTVIKKGETIVAQNSTPTSLYLVMAGSAVVGEESQVRASTAVSFLPGQLFGHFGTPLEPFSKPIIASENTALLKLSQNEIHAILSKYTQLAATLQKIEKEQNNAVAHR